MHMPGAVTVTLMAAIAVVSLYAALRSDRTFSREKAGMLLAASMLTVPYLQGLTILNVVAIGVIPMIKDRPLLGVLLVLVYDVPALGAFGVGSYLVWLIYWTAALLVTWVLLLAIVLRERRVVPVAPAAAL